MKCNNITSRDRKLPIPSITHSKFPNSQIPKLPNCQTPPINIKTQIFPVVSDYVAAAVHIPVPDKGGYAV